MRLEKVIQGWNMKPNSPREPFYGTTSSSCETDYEFQIDEGIGEDEFTESIACDEDFTQLVQLSLL